VQENENSGKRRRGLVAVVLSVAAVAVALPISGALASGDPAPTQAAPTQTQDQTTPRDESPRDRGDCPDKDGRGGGTASDASVEL
jgi:hypothetical protein